MSKPVKILFACMLCIGVIDVIAILINHFEAVRWRDNQTGNTETHAIRHVFLMTLAAPKTQWLDRRVVRDAQGFIKTGPDLYRDELNAAHWPLSRPPYLSFPKMRID